MSDANDLTTPQVTAVLGGVRLRPTAPDDCGFVVRVEASPENARYVEQWPAERHRASLTAPCSAHWIIEAHGEAAGYALLEDIDDPNGSILLRRIAISGKGRGLGRKAVTLLLRYCFDTLGGHRVWLHVAPENRRAGVLYERLGFVEEGIARECVRTADGYASMRVLSLLEAEYRAGPAAPRGQSCGSGAHPNPGHQPRR